MEQIRLGKSDLQVPRIGVGCMRIGGLEPKDAQRLIATALEHGLNFFDHADIYGGGSCETVFAKAFSMTSSVRDKIIVQSKCGIVPGKRYDFSKEHILTSVDGILERLRTDYLDVLLLHRPDALCDPCEVAEAFDQLYRTGKVRHFGVSNQNPGQIRLLQKYLKQPLVVNQLQMSITNATMISGGLHVNMEDASAVNRDGGVLDFCRLEEITIQPWSPFQYGFFEGVFLENPKFPKLNDKLEELAEKYGVTTTTLAMAWLLRHPAKLMPIVGTTNPTRLAQCAAAADIMLTRQEWYDIYLAAGNDLP